MVNAAAKETTKLKVERRSTAKARARERRPAWMAVVCICVTEREEGVSV